MGRANPIKLIVNADDLGISRDVNEATFSLMAEGRVTSASLLANGPAIDSAVREVSRFPQCSFGVHLNVIEFEPLSRSAAPILMKGGSMSRGLVEASSANPRFMRAVHREFSAQVEKVLQCGVRISHLDSHQHVHTMPWLFPVVKAIQARYGISCIRRSRNIYASSQSISRKLRLKKTLFHCALTSLYRSRTTDGMTDLETLIALDAEEARRFTSIEVMVHPGTGSLAKEVELLRSDWQKTLSFASQLASYRPEDWGTTDR